MAFPIFGPSHFIALAVIVLLGLFLVRQGPKISPKSLALLILVIHLPYQLIALLPANFNIQHSIPLQLCDLAWMICAVALWSQKRWSLRLIYYWGLTLTPQALLTPALKFNYPHMIYFGFWIDHGLVFLGTLYVAFVLKYRPDREDFIKAYGFTLAWGLFVLAFNSHFETNYMFLNQKPERSLLDLFGPWPYYLFVEATLTGVIWYFLLTPRKTK